MTDFNLEQFKAGRIAINHEGISGRYLGDLKDTDGNSIELMSVALSHPGRNGGQEWTHCFTPYGRSVNNSEEPFTKMKPEKKKLYIAITKEQREGEEYHMCTDAFYTMKGVSDQVKHIVDDSFVHQEAKKFQDVKIVEVEVEV